MRLFGNHIPPACKYCEKILRLLADDSQALCRRYGVVQADYKCRHFDYDPLWRVPPKLGSARSFTGKEFQL